MDIHYNEFDIPPSDPLDNLNAFLTIGNAQYYLDEHYKEVTKPIHRKIGEFIVAGMSSPQAFGPLIRVLGFKTLK